jgi:hypothetical protein
VVKIWINVKPENNDNADEVDTCSNEKTQSPIKMQKLQNAMMNIWYIL